MGPAGVQVFFILSGYLITRLLANRRPGYRAFLAARLRRLAPALGLMLLSCVALAWAVSPAFGWSVTGQAAVAALWATNLPMAAGAPAGTFNHCWSLALEMQFYLLWPLVLWLCRRVWVYNLRVCEVWIATVLWAIWLLGPEAWRAINPAGMIMGAALAIWSPLPLRLFRNIGKALSWPPLPTIGLLSYGIYLWHFPLAGLFVHVDWPVRLAVTLSLSTLLAALSYLTVERWAGCAKEPLWPRRAAGDAAAGAAA